MTPAPAVPFAESITRPVPVPAFGANAQGMTNLQVNATGCHAVIRMQSTHRLSFPRLTGMSRSCSMLLLRERFMAEAKQ